MSFVEALLRDAALRRRADSPILFNQTAVRCACPPVRPRRAAAPSAYARPVDFATPKTIAPRGLPIVPPRFATTGRNDDNAARPRIASPEMFPEAEMLRHLICSRPMFIGGAKDEADQHGGA